MATNTNNSLSTAVKVNRDRNPPPHAVAKKSSYNVTRQARLTGIQVCSSFSAPVYCFARISVTFLSPWQNSALKMFHFCHLRPRQKVSGSVVPPIILIILYSIRENKKEALKVFWCWTGAINPCHHQVSACVVRAGRSEENPASAENVWRTLLQIQILLIKARCVHLFHTERQ